MARKTAMKKEPTVSIAVPQYEKDRLRGLKPGGPSMADGLAQGKPGPVKRLSPGVYRSSSGQLVGSKGQALPGAPSLRERVSETARQAASGRGMGDGRDRAQQGNFLIDAMNRAQQPGQIATRPPAPLGTPAGAPQQDGQGSAPIGNMMGQMPQMSQADMNQFMQNLAFEQPQRPNSITGLLQRGGQQQQPMQPATRPPMPYGQGEEQQILAYTGGSPNFYNSDQYKSQVMPQRPEMPSMDYQQMATAMAERQAFAQQQMGQLQPPMGQYGYGRQMGQQYNPMQAPQRIPAQQNMQPQQGIVAPRPGVPNNGNIY